MSTARQGKPPAARPRTTARMAAVQALYQMDLAGTEVEQVIDEFERLRFAVDPRATAAEDGESQNDLVGADATFFAELLHGVIRRQREIDPLIDHQLAQGWRLKRIDSILRAILRAGTFELLERQDVPARVAITEYINVAHDFFDDDGPKVVNGVLDAIARIVRPADLDGAAGGKRQG